jgi:WD40 repeat protein
LSGGADRTIRIWDMMSGRSGSSGPGDNAACLHTLSGHFGWVKHVQYWGPNTIVSGSTDRTIALWDARVRNSPLFVLRHHHAPISDILVGSRTDPLMVSAASDGTVTTWDFRSLSGAAPSQNHGSAASSSDATAGGSRHCKVVRHPSAIMSLGPAQDRFSLAKSGPFMLSRGDQRSAKTVLSAGGDAVMREWDVSTGRLVKEWSTGHCDALSSLTSLAEASSSTLLGVNSESEASSSVGGTITSSWDGTIRMRKRIPRPAT